jgi:hypothetical protein
MFTPELASEAVETALNDWRLPEMDLWAVFPAGRLASAKARALLRSLRPGCGADHTLTTAPDDWRLSRSPQH